MSSFAPRLPLVVVAGRPNVGKSSLVNRIVGHRAAVVEETPGVTRDRKVLDAEWNGKTFQIVDTGGWLAKGSTLDAKVSAQAERALDEADVILFVVDVISEVTEQDLSAARRIHQVKAPTLLVVNKVDSNARELNIWEFMSLGLGDPYPVSALHGRGTGDLLDEVVRLLPEREIDLTGSTSGDESVVPRIALIGRPNVGKSTLFNRLIGQERSVVHDMPGTTIDTIDTLVTTADGELCFVDTAGLRRPSKTARGIEQHSVIRALDALERADIALLVIDATVGATHQDQRLAERIGVSGCPALVVLNKWDLVDPEDRENVLDGVGERLAFLGTAPVIKTAANLGRGVHKILPAIKEAVSAYHLRIPTGTLNRALQDIQASHPPVGVKIRYCVQGAIDPPTFTLFTNGRLHQTYLRYIERSLRERFELGSTPIKLRVRTG